MLSFQCRSRSAMSCGNSFSHRSACAPDCSALCRTRLGTTMFFPFSVVSMQQLYNIERSRGSSRFHQPRASQTSRDEKEEPIVTLTSSSIKTSLLLHRVMPYYYLKIHRDLTSLTFQIRVTKIWSLNVYDQGKKGKTKRQSTLLKRGTIKIWERKYW